LSMKATRAMAHQICREMTKAIMLEAIIWPSPGLVNLWDSGSHTDMDIRTFLTSARAIQPYLYASTYWGISKGTRRFIEEEFPTLKMMGLKAERAMLRATQGVNTHKGTIFLGLLLCASAGMHFRWHGRITPGPVCATAQRLAARSLEQELVQLGKSNKNPITTGIRAYRELGLLGIRGEVIRGFPSILRVGLPALKRAMRRGHSLRESSAHALLALMSVVEDTTVLNRVFDPGRIRYTQEWARRVLRAGSVFTPLGQRLVAAMHEDFIARSISPGGSADLLSMCLALFFWEVKFGHARKSDFDGEKPPRLHSRQLGSRFSECCTDHGEHSGKQKKFPLLEGTC